VALLVVAEVKEEITMDKVLDQVVLVVLVPFTFTYKKEG
jgi:hypothetical protein